MMGILSKWEEPTSIPRTYFKRSDVVVCICNPSVGNADTDRSLGLWPASRAVSASSRPRCQTLSQKTRWMVLSNDSKVAFWLSHSCAHMQLCTYKTCTHALAGKLLP